MSISELAGWLIDHDCELSIKRYKGYFMVTISSPKYLGIATDLCLEDAIHFAQNEIVCKIAQSA